jgi:hypothetical protein
LRRLSLKHHAVVEAKNRVNVIVIGDAAGAFLDAEGAVTAAVISRSSRSAHFRVLDAVDFFEQGKVAPLPRVVFGHIRCPPLILGAEKAAAWILSQTAAVRYLSCSPIAV